MSRWIYEIALRIIVFVSMFVYFAAGLLIMVGIEGRIYPEYRVIAILGGVLLVPFAPIATGLLMARLGERTRTCVGYAIGGMIFPFVWVMWSVHRHRATRLLYASRKADDAGLRALGELNDITRTREPRGVESRIQCARGNWDPTIRADAILWVSGIKTSRVLEVLTEALKDKDRRVRRAAADALGHWQDAQAIAPLEQALDDKNEDVRKAVEAALAKLKSSPQPSNSIESLRSAVLHKKEITMNTYHNKKWNLTFVYPPDWEIIWENEPDGGWEIIVGVAGKPSRSGRSSVTIRILPHAVVNFYPANTVVTAAGGSGMPMELPRTPEEYNERCKLELRNALPGVRFISEEIGTLAGMPAATLVYSYAGKHGTIREKQINLFGPNVTYRLLSEAPEDQIESTDKYFDEVVANFKPVTGA